MCVVFQLTTSRISNHTRLMLNLLKVTSRISNHTHTPYWTLSAPMPTRRGSLWTGCFLFAWQPDKPFTKKATVCCIGLFFHIVRRCRQLLLVVFSIQLSCLLLLCTQRTSSNLFIVVMYSSSVRSTLSARRPFFVQLLFCPVKKKNAVFLWFHCPRAYKELRAHIILATFLCSMWSGMHVFAYRHKSWFRGGRRYIRRGLGVAPMPTRRGSLWTGCFLFACQPDKPFAKNATVCCIVFFVRRCQLLLLVFSILLSCFLLLCTQRTSSNLFVAVMHSSCVWSYPLRTETFVSFAKKAVFCEGSIIRLFRLLRVFVQYTGCNFRRWQL